MRNGDMSQLHSTNPVTGVVSHSFNELNDVQVLDAIDTSAAAYLHYKTLPITKRVQMMHSFATLLRQKREYLCHLITEEIGTPVDQANSEIEKSAYISEYFADNAEKFLRQRNVNGVATQAHVQFDPLGVVLHIAPWNYPFYLALRPVITALLAGNTVILKHASNVPRISTVLEGLFREAGYGDIFQSLLIGSSKVNQIIAHPAVVMVTLIGSEYAGSKVAQEAGLHIKKTLMELGGSDPFIVFEDADIDKAVEAATYSRLRNCGQSCNAAKRFIVHSTVFDEFCDKLKTSFENFSVGDPMDTSIDMGPMATKGGVTDTEELLKDAQQKGGKIITGGKKLFDQGYFFQPTIVTNISRDMRLMKEESFGPIAPVIAFDSTSEAIEIANDSVYGLGASVWTSNKQIQQECISMIESGNVYVNKMVRSDPKLPFGGIKRSGYGREFSDFGLLEFTNIKSVVIE